jgi:hypothetical protein
MSLQVPQVSSQLTKLLTSADFETARYASLSVVRFAQRARRRLPASHIPQGNLVLEQSGRGDVTTIACVRAQSDA